MNESQKIIIKETLSKEYDIMKQCFSNKLQQLRKQNGLSQEALAEILDVSRQSVSKWESGQVYPEIDKIIFISEYFHVSIDELLKDDVKPQRRRINLSKPVTMVKPAAEPEQEQDIMPEPPPFVNQMPIPPVQPSQTAAPPAAVKKKVNQHKKKLSKLIIAGISVLGGIVISVVIAAGITGNDGYISPTYSIEENDYEEQSEEQTATALYAKENDEGTVEIVEYEYNPDEILNRIFYYYDEESGKYTEVLVPYTDFETFTNHEYFQTAKVYMEQYQAYLDVISFDKEGYYRIYGEPFPDDEVQTARFYSEQFQRYIKVLIPPNGDIDYWLEIYGYRLVDIYDNDGGIYKTIVRIQ